MKTVIRTWMINGEMRTAEFPPMRRLLDVLREDLGLKGTKEGCGEGECGAGDFQGNGQLSRARGERRIATFAVALGSVAPTSIRLRGVEQWLVGRTSNKETLVGADARAAEEVKPIADIRSIAEYRRWVSGRLVRFFIEHLAAGGV